MLNIFFTFALHNYLKNKRVIFYKFQTRRNGFYYTLDEFILCYDSFPNTSFLVKVYKKFDTRKIVLPAKLFFSFFFVRTACEDFKKYEFDIL